MVNYIIEAQGLFLNDTKRIATAVEMARMSARQLGLFVTIHEERATRSGPVCRVSPTGNVIYFA